MAPPTLDALKIAFADEDTATWTAAARALGQRAVDDPEALAFILRWLAAHPAEASAANIHRFRHACCALAALKSAGPGPAEAEGAFERHIRAPLLALTHAGLKAAGGTVADLARIPGGEARFVEWRAQQQANLQERLDKLAATGNAKGLAANQAKLDALLALTPEAPVPEGLRLDGPGLLPQAPWALASYFSGVLGPAALVGVPLDLLVLGVLEAARPRRENGLALVVNLPALLLALQGQVPEAEWARAHAAVLEAHDPTWVTERLHYNEYVLSVSRLPGAGPFLTRWTRGLELPPKLQEDLHALAAEVEAAPRAAARRAARLMRRLAEAAFEDDWRFEELDPGERFGLNVFALLAVRGPGPLAARDDAEAATPALEHRITLVLAAARRSFEAREQVLPTLVRCLKLLLDRELLGASKHALGDVCRRQVALVRPWVAEWRLPGTLRKDLAIIVCRVLLFAFRQDRAAFAEILYYVLYALPDEVLFREVLEYSTEDGVSRVVEAAVGVVEAAHADAAPAVLQARYQAFAAVLAELSQDTPEAAWTAQLPGVVASLTRQATDAPQAGPVEAALQVILRCQGDPAEDATLSAGRRGDKKGAAWAAREAAQRAQHASRSVFDRFSRLLDELQVLESDCLPEVGRPRATDDLARRWRRLISALDALVALSAEALPYLEREVVVALLKARVAGLEARLGALVQVLEREDEAVAATLVSGTPEAPEDGRLVREWMLGRYMIRELAEAQGLRVLRLLTAPGFVALWVLAPFVACGALAAAGLTDWAGFPFAVALGANVALVAAFFTEARRAPSTSAGRYLLPQITAALFLGIMEVLAADEAWSLAVLELGWVRVFTVLAFLGTGFFFIREVLLGRQADPTAARGRRSRRAAQVMALVLWQSFALVLLFTLLGGRVMAERAGLDAAAYVGLSDAASALLPHEVRLFGVYRVFPWALVSWTVQVFFFSAIFERIMRAD
jgi:hypothetical protein